MPRLHIEISIGSIIEMPNFETPDWAALLREMRDVADMKQAQIAKAVGLTQGSISVWVTDKPGVARPKAVEYTRGLRILAAHKDAMKRAGKQRKSKAPA